MVRFIIGLFVGAVVVAGLMALVIVSEEKMTKTGMKRTAKSEKI